MKIDIKPTEKKPLTFKARKFISELSKSEKAYIFTFVLYLLFIIAIAAISPFSYMFAFIPLFFSIIIYVITPQSNEKFLKDINDTTLYIFGSCKVFSLAVQSTDEKGLKDFLNGFSNADVSIITWLIIIMCTYLKTIICGYDSIRFIRNKFKEKKFATNNDDFSCQDVSDQKKK